MPFGNIIDKSFKCLCNLLRIFETRIAITIMANQHQHHNCEEDITILDIIKIIAQPYLLYGLLKFSLTKYFPYTVDDT